MHVLAVSRVHQRSDMLWASQVDATDDQLLQQLRDSGTLLSDLRQLKSLFLLGAPAACDFAGGSLVPVNSMGNTCAG